MLGSEKYDFRFDLGIGQSVNSIGLEDVDSIVSAIAKHYAILSVKAELDQMLCGISSTLGTLDLIRQHPRSLRSLFVYCNALLHL